MVGYRRMGNMGQQHMENATSAVSPSRHLRDMWKSPRGTVLRIEALALVAIFLSFFLAIFGSCRRWSNHFLIQKGFLAANALFLSLGTYSIGLMQSSRVKSEMYPIWAVSLLALLCCVDSAAASGFDNRNQLWKMLYQLCLYFGYVLLMSITTISSDIGNIAICVSAALTFFKGFHRSVAFVLPSSMRNMIREFPASGIRKCSFGDLEEESSLIVDKKLDVFTGNGPIINMGGISSMRCEEGKTGMVQSDLDACKDVCLSFSLSHLLHRRFLGLSSSIQQITTTSTEPLVKNQMRAFKVVETELAFMYDVLYNSNAFLYYYEARVASIWAFASVIGICFVGAVAIVPTERTTTTRHASPGSSSTSTILVDTTTADFVITGVILVSLALMQVLQLLRCWTSNWARVAFACDYARNDRRSSSWGMRLRASLLKMSWFDDKYHLWQNKVGQYSVIDESIKVQGRLNRPFSAWPRVLFCMLCCFRLWKCLGLFGLQYIRRELQEMLRGCGSESPIELHPDVKASIMDFIGNEIRSDQVRDWASSSVENGQNGFPDFPFSFIPDWSAYWSGYGDDEMITHAAGMDDEMIYASCILMWHIATCYCERRNQAPAVVVDNNDHRVATALSKYCAYLVAEVPRLLPGRSETTKSAYGQVMNVASFSARDWIAGEMDRWVHGSIAVTEYNPAGAVIAVLGVKLGEGLQGKAPAERWKVLADFWVKALVYAAPSDNAEEHMQRLSQGGELITHLWAMLYHAGIHRWQLNPPTENELKIGWDYIFRIRSWNDLDHHKGKNKQLVKEDRPSEVRTDACPSIRLDGASSSCPPSSP